MPTSTVHERAAADFAAGRHREGRRRLRDALDVTPQDVEARRLLVSSYRSTGQLDQAGRWAFACDQVAEDELRAFARTFQNDPVLMLRALRWSGAADDAPSAAARARMSELRARAERQSGTSQPWESWQHPLQPTLPSDVWVFAAIAVALLLLLACLVVGAVTLVRWALGLF